VHLVSSSIRDASRIEGMVTCGSGDYLIAALNATGGRLIIVCRA
jgi:hypothetical protein